MLAHDLRAGGARRLVFATTIEIKKKKKKTDGNSERGLFTRASPSRRVDDFATLRIMRRRIHGRSLRSDRIASLNATRHPCLTFDGFAGRRTVAEPRRIAVAGEVP